MKSLLLAICLVVAPLTAQASPILSFNPTFQSVPLGTQASVDVVISGLEQGQTIGAFDFAIYFDPAIVSLNSSSFGSALGVATINDVVSALGSLNAASVSLEDPVTLLALQSTGSFTAFTAVFNTLSVGTTPLLFGLTPFVFSDGEGEDIAVTASNGSITVTGTNAVPDAGSMLSIAFSLGAVWLLKRRQGLEV